MKPIHILLAEDNEDHADLTMDTLTGNNIRNIIYHVPDGQACLDFLYNEGEYTDKEKYPKPNLILLDIRMPKKSGIEVLSVIKSDEQLRKIPVVMLTTSKKEEEIVSAHNLGASSYVTKPVGFDEFSEKLRNLQIYWVLVAEHVY